MDRVIILLANGFEEIEALAPLDVLRRLNYDVKLVSMNSSLEVIVYVFSSILILVSYLFGFGGCGFSVGYTPSKQA